MSLKHFVKRGDNNLISIRKPDCAWLWEVLQGNLLNFVFAITYQTYLILKLIYHPLKLMLPGTSLAVQWLRIGLPMQGTWVRSLVWEDSTCHRTIKPTSHNYFFLVKLNFSFPIEIALKWKAHLPLIVFRRYFQILLQKN